MIGNQGIKQGNCQADQRTKAVTTEGVYQISHCKGEHAHLEQGVKGHCNDHISGKGVAQVVKKPNGKRMEPGVVIAIGDEVKDLLQLIDAVRRHNAGILVQKVRKPSQKTDQECKKPSVCTVLYADLA